MKHTKARHILMASPPNAPFIHEGSCGSVPLFAQITIYSSAPGHILLIYTSRGSNLSSGRSHGVNPYSVLCRFCTHRTRFVIYKSLS